MHACAYAQKTQVQTHAHSATLRARGALKYDEGALQHWSDPFDELVFHEVAMRYEKELMAALARVGGV